MPEPENRIYNDDSNIIESNDKNIKAIDSVVMDKTVNIDDKLIEIRNEAYKRRRNYIFWIFTLLDILMLITSDLSGYGGWNGMGLVIIVFPGILVIGAILAVILAKNYDEKVTSIFRKVGYCILPALYLCVFLFGVFFVGDNGDAEGYGSMFSVVLGGGLDFSYYMMAMLYKVFFILLLVVVLSLVVYYAKKKHSIK